MKKLSAEAQQQIGAFMQSDAVRPLERALYAYHFSGGSAADVLAALTGFQNADGGFGHGLEADIRLPASSVIATSVAFQKLRDMGAPADHPLVVKGCRYLRDQYKPAAANWDIIPANVDDAPHAPWWVYGGGLSESRLNPHAEIAGYLHEYAEHFPADMREQVTKSILAHVESSGIDDMHDLFCVIRLYETKALPDSIKARLLPLLKTAVEKLVARDPASWAEYGLPPLGVVSSLDSPFAPLFTDELDANLDYVIEELGDSNHWSPSWTWGEPSAAWEEAKREWSGVITLNNLVTLKTFGRLA